MKRDCIPEGLSRAFYEYGKIVARCPLPFVLAPVIATLALLAGFLFINNTSDLEYLYVPIHAPAKTERHHIEETFLYSEGSYYSGMRRTRLKGLLRLLVQDKGGGNLFTDERMGEVFKLDSFVKSVKCSHGNGELRYRDVCARWQHECADSENTFLNYMRNESVKDIDLNYPVDTSQTRPMFLAPQLGSVKLDSYGFIYHIKALMLYYPVRFDKDDVTHQDRSTAWSRKLVDEILKYKSGNLSVNIETFESIERELESAIFEVTHLFTMTFMILGSFAFSSLLMSDWVRGKPLISSAGMIAAVLGAGSGMGFLLLCGVRFNTAVGAVPFLIIGIGMDDMYIMVSAWRCTSCALPVEERLGLALKHSAVSITITSITDALAFGIGIITPFRSVQMFCGYTMVGVVFCYFYQLTFTLACMAYDGRREHSNRHCITFRPITNKSCARNRSKLFQWFCTGGSEPLQDAQTKEEIRHLADSSRTKLPYVNKFMGTAFATFLMKTPVKTAVVLIYALYLGFAIYGITLMEEGLDRSNLVPDTSYYVTFFQDSQRFFDDKRGPAIMFVYDEPLNYSNQSVRQEIKHNFERFKRNKYFLNDEYAATSWLKYYEEYLSLTWRDIDDLSEEDFIRILREEFLTIPFNYFLSDITFDSSNRSIISSRMFIQSKGAKTAIEEREIMITAREIAKESKFKAYTYHMAFPYFDQYTIILSTTLQNLGIATACMLVVALIFIPSIATVLWVTLTTVSIEIGVLGYMAFWDVSLDSISMINLIMCIGFSVDFAAHISYHYTISKSSDPAECAKDALGHLGTPILQSAISTILGVAVLSFSSSYIFRTFFKIVTLVMIFGSYHGLFLLPVLLSTIKSFENARQRESQMTSQTDDIVGSLQNGHGVRYKSGPLESASDLEYRVEIFLK